MGGAYRSFSKEQKAMDLKKIKAKTDVVSSSIAARGKQLVMSVVGASGVTPIALNLLSASADSAGDIASQLVKWIGAAAIVLGIITLVVGLMTFFGAEDDGPQKAKGKGQIAAGIVVIAVGGAMQTDTISSQIGTWVDDAFSNS